MTQEQQIRRTHAQFGGHNDHCNSKAAGPGGDSNLNTPCPGSFHEAAMTKTPAHLSPEAAAWWQDVTADYSLEAHHLKLLQAACEAWDTMQAARRALSEHGGLTFTDAGGNIKAHPAVAMQRDARVAFARLLRELDLDVAGAPAEAPRPPAIRSNRRG